MIRSDSLAELTVALSAAQGEFEAVSKSASNPFFKSSYAPLPEVVKVATPILAKNGLAVWQGADTDDTGELLWTIVLHSSGQFIGSAARMLPVKGDSQAQGSAQTYQRRYQYMAALGLVADADDDGNAASNRQPARSKPVSQPKARGKGNTQPKPSNGHSVADGGSQATPDASGAQVSEDTLKEIGKAYKAAGVTAPVFKSILREVGLPDGKGSDELSEDQASWVVLKLTAIADKAATG